VSKIPNLVFVWHMHQPPYVDPESGKAIMPWVRLHAIHAYYDMASILDEFPNLKMTFNFSPCLLSQMENHLVSPSLGTIIKLARGIGCESG
jgi:alpha-amylase/alpha-mannosidase (GH57 family)